MSHKERAVLGIDPGKTGAMCLLTEHGELHFHDFSDIANVESELIQIKDSYIVCGAAIEHVRPLRINGSISNFKLGHSLGMWEAILTNNYIPYELIGPHKWQSTLPEYRKDSELTGKRRSIAAAHRLYPQSQDFIYRVKDHNRADALLIAHQVRSLL